MHTPYIVNFNKVRQAATSDNIAQLLRLEWDLDAGSDGSVFLSRADIEQRLADGTLEPVLTVDQFMSISRGKAYGNIAATEDHPGPANQSSVQTSQPRPNDALWEHHSDYQEYQALPAAVRASLDRGFPDFLFFKQKGQLQSLCDYVIQEDAKQTRKAAQRQQKESLAREIAGAAGPARSSEVRRAR